MSGRMWARSLICLCSLAVCAAFVTAQEQKPGQEPKKIDPQKIVEEGKKIKPSDGLIAVWTLLKYRFAGES